MHAVRAKIHATKVLKSGESFSKMFNIKSYTHIGEGGFGTVYKCRIRKRQSDKNKRRRRRRRKRGRRREKVPFVAVKWLAKKDEFSEDDFNQEVKMLKRFGSHPSIVSYIGSCIYFDKINYYIVTEYVDTDLHTLMENQKLTMPNIQHIMKQLLQAVAHIHSAGVVHRDIKPSNVLVHSKEYDVKLADFGSATQMTDASTRKGMTGHIVTAPYRAPEIMNTMGRVHDGLSHYGVASDIWSVGCLFAALLTGKMLFYKNEDEKEEEEEDIVCGQLKVINNTYNNVLDRIKNGSRYEISLDIAEVIMSMLMYHPGQRKTAEELLQLKFFNE